MISFLGFFFRLLTVLPAMILFSVLNIIGWILCRIGDIGKVVHGFARSNGEELGRWVDGHMVLVEEVEQPTIRVNDNGNFDFGDETLLDDIHPDYR